MGRRDTDVSFLVLPGDFVKDFKEELETVIDHGKLKISLEKNKVSSNHW